MTTHKDQAKTKRPTKRRRSKRLKKSSRISCVEPVEPYYTPDKLVVRGLAPRASYGKNYYDPSKMIALDMSLRPSYGAAAK